MPVKGREARRERKFEVTAWPEMEKRLAGSAKAGADDRGEEKLEDRCKGWLGNGGDRSRLGDEASGGWGHGTSR